MLNPNKIQKMFEKWYHFGSQGYGKHEQGHNVNWVIPRLTQTNGFEAMLETPSILGT